MAVCTSHSASLQENDKAEEQPWRRGDLAESPVISRCTEHFLKQYTIVRTDLKKQVQYITDAAFRSVGATLDDEREKVLSSFAGWKHLFYKICIIILKGKKISSFL